VDSVEPRCSRGGTPVLDESLLWLGCNVSTPLLSIPDAAREPPVRDPACEPHQDYSGHGNHYPVHHAIGPEALSQAWIMRGLAFQPTQKLQDLKQNNGFSTRRLGPIGARAWTHQRPPSLGLAAWTVRKIRQFVRTMHRSRRRMTVSSCAR
jgi:hypothetical protein